ncbi:MAG: hypothetical protein HYV07_26660 [Deltaproteobacteria bacterium]|nr:hypothetical protein [Deltaproteobacteria bacterium]
MSMPSLPHVLYIPFVLTVGAAIGWILGSRAVKKDWDRADALRKKREEEG